LNDAPAHSTILFTDIEGSTRLWEREPQRMAKALAVHDELARSCLAQHRGMLIKTTGDGIHAVFDEPLNGVLAMLQLQQGLADPATTEGLMLPVRSGLHHGPVGWRGGDVYGTVVNRAARIAAAAHGGQMLISGAVLRLVAPRLPDGLGLRDLGRVRLRDLTEPEHLHQLVHPALRSEFPALRSLEATPNNLARQLNPFIGRQVELDAVRRILTRQRQVTLLGPGGIGKSRLSLQVAAEVIDEFPDGVWFVNLAPIGDPRLVPHTLATVLGVAEEPGRTMVDSLLAHARDLNCLLILDNCEHLLPACASLTLRLLERCGAVRIIASSREALHIAGECCYPVPALSTPGPDEIGSAHDLERHDAVGLFAERARAVRPDFRIDTANAAVVAEICRRLDGLPLAIELAAARIRAMSLESISVRLSDRFRLLSTTDSTVLPRQQTLRALIDWSYELLSPLERLLLCRLAVFRGGWTLESAEEVCGGDGVETEAVMDLLIQLVEKSLVVCDADSDRYRLLDTVRAYALEKLDEAGLGGAMRAAHLGHCVRLAEAARQKLTGPHQAAWLERLDRERENLIAAHGRAGQVDDGARQGLALVFLLRPYWFKRGLMALGLGLAKEMLALPAAARRDMPRCRGLFAAGQFGYFMGHHAAARRYLGESLAIAREQGDSDAVAMVLQPLGMACLGEGDSVAALIYLEEAVALAQEGTNSRELAAALNNLAQLHRSQGHFDRAAPLYTQALDLARGFGDRDYIAVLLLNLAIVAIGQGKPNLAGPLLVETFGEAIDIQSVPIQLATLDVAACLCAVCGDETLAARLFGASATQSDATGLTRDPSDDAFVLPLLERARERLGLAAWVAAEASGRQISFDDAKSTAQEWLRERAAAT
jgi:predicted ATPase/class 3 adenylate cyclase